MIRLSQTSPALGVPNLSPACLKLETWLRITGIPYEVAPLDLSLAPKGKVPFIEDRNGRMGDSALIIEYLKKEYRKDPDERLTDVERAISLAFRRMLKESFYWVIIESRWRDETNWSVYKDTIGGLFAGLPEEQRTQVLNDLRATMLNQLQSHGMGRHTPAEVHQFGMAELKAVSDYLGDKPFFMGDAPTTADATVYGLVTCMIDISLSCPVKDYGLQLKNLASYTKRMRAKFYPELS